MNSSKTRKAINFDLSDALLKENYPSKNYKKGWGDIKLFLENYQFTHRQYSGYVSKEGISMTDVGSIIDDMVIHYNWLRKCVLEFDVTIVGNEYSFLDRIQKENSLYL